jgi:hypothetical protein
MERKFRRLKGKSVTDKAMGYELITDVIDEQYGNLTGRHFEKNGSYRQVTSILRDFARDICRMAMLNSARPTFEKGWKNDFSNQTYHILKAQNLDLHIKKYVDKMRMCFPKHVTKSDLINYSFLKIANHAGCVSRMILHGYHPDFILATPREANEALLERANRLRKGGASVIVVAV